MLKNIFCYLLALICGMQMAFTMPSIAVAADVASPVTAPAAQQAVEPSPKDEYKLGWRASIYAFGKGANVAAELPSAAVGSFLFKKSSFKITDYIKPLGFPLSQKTILWRGQAFLIVKEAGHHVFIMDINHAAYGAIFVEGNKLTAGSSGFNGKNTIVGNANLEPGIYKLEIHAAGMVDGVTAHGYTENQGTSNFTLRLKRPNDDTPQLIEKFLHVKK